MEVLDLANEGPMVVGVASITDRLGEQRANRIELQMMNVLAEFRRNLAMK